jgi:hypothetical protein
VAVSRVRNRRDTCILLALNMTDVAVHATFDVDVLHIPESVSASDHPKTVKYLKQTHSIRIR